MQQTISTVADIKQKIEAGRKLLLAGDEDALRQLPKGDWIAGTINCTLRTLAMVGSVLRS